MICLFKRQLQYIRTCLTPLFFQAFSNDKIMGKLGVYVGLAHVNVTLQAMPIYYNESMDVNFNERLRFDGPRELQEEYR